MACLCEERYQVHGYSLLQEDAELKQKVQSYWKKKEREGNRYGSAEVPGLDVLWIDEKKWQDKGIVVMDSYKLEYHS